MARGQIVGASALAVAAAAATFAGLQFQPRDKTAPDVAARETTPATLPADPEKMICLQTTAPLALAIKRACYPPATFEAARDSAVLDDEGAPIALEMAHPQDAAAPTTTVRTCADYDGLAAADWYAMSAKDMRREERFVRTCGALRALAAAKPPTATYFEGGRLSDADIASMTAGQTFSIGEASIKANAVRTGDGQWSASDDAAGYLVQELAHGDFDGDGLGDVLVFVRLGAKGGSAAGATLGIAQKFAEGGPCSFKPLSR